MSEKACSKCTARKNTERGTCTRTTCKYGPKCWQHTQLQDGLEVKKSKIAGAGMGLFAKKEFKSPQTIATYTGEFRTEEQLNRKYPGNTLAPYAIETGRNTGVYVDAAKTNSGVARYANDCRGNNKACNAVLAQDPAASQSNPRVAPKLEVKPVTIKRAGKRYTRQRTIKKGEEILAKYGTGYWQRGAGKGKGKRHP